MTLTGKGEMNSPFIKAAPMFETPAFRQKQFDVGEEQRHKAPERLAIAWW